MGVVLRWLENYAASTLRLNYRLRRTLASHVVAFAAVAEMLRHARLTATCELRRRLPHPSMSCEGSRQRQHPRTGGALWWCPHRVDGQIIYDVFLFLAS